MDLRGASAALIPGGRVFRCTIRARDPSASSGMRAPCLDPSTRVPVRTVPTRVGRRVGRVTTARPRMPAFQVSIAGYPPPGVQMTTL